MPTYHAKKRLGQNFLTSEKVIRHIIERVSPSPGQTIVEVGSGRGALTWPLAESGATIWAIEFDRDLIDYLDRLLMDHKNVTVLERDFLAFDPDQYNLDRFALVGNLPYNITSPVVDWCIRYHDRITAAYFMMQREVADRLTAAPGTHDWSPISISAQLHFDLTCCFEVPPHAFTPIPEVVSAFVELKPIPVRSDIDMQALDRVVRGSFQQRRKQLVNNLVPNLIPDAESARRILQVLGLRETVRAEELSIDQFCRLTNHLSPGGTGGH
ncbi:ribosomal RNA small subunit methyltransferase A [candidate division GN15 bacterium]|uniref:Ribosomal RNA small subunit methyltransferase A n=1 Tax=candidate division GN15 bacterium TaxID=2072418 RepID=A0A855X3E7_9BACT|nr:MAG: ribosomal RNA small subunit methyltransferase A [candidate division GN15 bacterium]